MNRKTFILTLLATIPGLKWLAEKLQPVKYSEWTSPGYLAWADPADPRSTVELTVTRGNGMTEVLLVRNPMAEQESKKYDVIMVSGEGPHLVEESNANLSTFRYLNDSSLR